MYYEVWSYHSCAVIVNMLTKEQAEEVSGPRHSFAYVREMDPEIVESILNTGNDTCENG